MTHPAVPNGRRTPRRVPQGEILQGAGAAVVPGTGIPMLTFIITDYCGMTPDDALAYLWQLYQDRYPGAFVQVVHRDDPGWEPIR